MHERLRKLWNGNATLTQKVYHAKFTLRNLLTSLFSWFASNSLELFPIFQMNSWFVSSIIHYLGECSLTIENFQNFVLKLNMKKLA